MKQASQASKASKQAKQAKQASNASKHSNQSKQCKQAMQASSAQEPKRKSILYAIDKKMVVQTRHTLSRQAGREIWTSTVVRLRVVLDRSRGAAVTCVVGGLSGALFVGYSAQMYIYIYMLLDKTSVGYPGIEKFFGRWTTGDLIPTSPPRREVTLSGA